MIQISRTEAPEYFQSERLLLAKEELKRRFENSSQERIKFDSSVLAPIKPELHNLFKGKCAYCESAIGARSGGDIDNFRPKGGSRGLKGTYARAHYWWLAYNWDNLLLSCQICNQKYKRDWFPVETEEKRAPIGAEGTELLKENALLIDPCNDLPSEHLQFTLDGTINDLSIKGKTTIELLGLNRPELLRQRQAAIVKLQNRLKLGTTQKKNHSSLHEYVKELFSESPSQEFAAAQRAAFNAWHRENPDVWARIEGKLGSSAKNVSLEKTTGYIDLSQDITAKVNFSSEEVTRIDEELSSIKRFSIKSIEIKNFKGIKDLQLSIPPVTENENESRESWLLMLGDNGIGKSSILQAVALTLVGKEQLRKLRPKPNEYLKRGENEGFVRIHSYEHSEPIELLFNGKKIVSNLDSPPTFIMAYGSTRLLPKGNLKSQKNPNPFSNVSNLFDYSVPLADANAWLKNIPPEEFNQRIAPALFDLLDLKDGDAISHEKGTLHLTRRSEAYTLEEISDGYKSIVALACDIMQTLSTDNSSYHSTQGIVLIDELGNHLHPRWRMKIASALRRTFPKLQFIVTTHEPLCLRGLIHGEVVVLMNDSDNDIRALDKTLLPDHSLLRIDQLLTSDLFGLINTLDAETEMKYEEYYRLLSMPETDRSDDDKQRISEYTSKLAQNEFFASTPQMEVVFKLVNEQFAQNIKKGGFKTKNELKNETISEVKNMIDKENLNWL